MLSIRRCRHVALIALLVLLTACSGTAASDAEPHGPRNGHTYVFGNIAYDLADEWNAYSLTAFQYAATKEKVEVISIDSGNDVDRSIAAMQELIDRHVDGISVFPISPAQAGRLGRMANHAGIPVTFENTTPDLRPDRYVSLVAAQYGQIGAAAMDYIASRYPNARVLYVAGARGGGVYESYQAGIDAEVARLDGEVSVVSRVHGDWQTARALTVTTRALRTGPRFDVVFANNELMAKGVRTALKNAGLSLPIVSTGGGPDGLRLIESGDLAATISAPVSLQGMMSLRCLYDFVVKGRQGRKNISLLIQPVDRSTLDTAISWTASDRTYAYAQSVS